MAIHAACYAGLLCRIYAPGYNIFEPAPIDIIAATDRMRVFWLISRVCGVRGFSLARCFRWSCARINTFLQCMRVITRSVFDGCFWFSRWCPGREWCFGRLSKRERVSQVPANTTKSHRRMGEWSQGFTRGRYRAFQVRGYPSAPRGRRRRVRACWGPSRGCRGCFRVAGRW